VPPWWKRIDITVNLDYQEAAQMARDAQGIIVATCSSEKNGIVGMGGAICDTTTTRSSNTAPTATYTATLGLRDRLNLYFAELIAISTALRNLAALPTRNRVINILSSNRSALQVINHPKQQSGQAYIHQIYESASKLKDMDSQISAIWAPAHEEINIEATAKAMAKRATTKQATGLRKEVQERILSAKATVLRHAIAKHTQTKSIERTGEYTKKLDTALPGKHTYFLYNSFKRAEASILAQLRTGMTKLNGYLHRIGASETDQCPCGQARETVEHFLFRCTRWDQYRERMLQQTETKMGCLSFFLGGKGPSDPAS
jgi:ribonuclease HI